MSIRDTVLASKKDNYKDDFARLDEEDFLILEDIQNRIHLRKCIHFIKELDSFVKDESIENLNLHVSREYNNSEDITTHGWWSLRVDTEEPETFETGLTDKQYYDLLSIAGIFNSYQFEARINEEYEDKPITVPLSDTQKLYEYLLPNKILKEFQAQVLSEELTSRNTDNPKKMKL